MIDSYPGPLKKDRAQKNYKTRSCDDEATSSKPVSIGRDGVEDTQANPSCTVTKCGKSRCKTCKYIVDGDSFTSNTTGRKYNIISNNHTMNCETKNVVFLISCKRC